MSAPEKFLCSSHANTGKLAGFPTLFEINEERQEIHRAKQEYLKTGGALHFYIALYLLLAFFWKRRPHGAAFSFLPI